MEKREKWDWDGLKNSVPVMDVLRAYMPERPIVSKKVACWEHNDRNPSMTIYPDARSGNWCWCERCRKGFSILDITKQAFGLDEVQSAKKLAEDFNIDLERYFPNFGNKNKENDYFPLHEFEMSLIGINGNQEVEPADTSMIMLKYELIRSLGANKVIQYLGKENSTALFIDEIKKLSENQQRFFLGENGGFHPRFYEDGKLKVNQYSDAQLLEAGLRVNKTEAVVEPKRDYRTEWNQKKNESYQDVFNRRNSISNELLSKCNDYIANINKQITNLECIKNATERFFTTEHIRKGKENIEKGVVPSENEQGLYSIQIKMFNLYNASISKMNKTCENLEARGLLTPEMKKSFYNMDFIRKSNVDAFALKIEKAVADKTIIEKAMEKIQSQTKNRTMNKGKSGHNKNSYSKQKSYSGNDAHSSPPSAFGNR